jgi:hypothetical protein
MAAGDHDVEICNEALVSLGVRVGLIEDLDDSSREAQLCSLFFPLARRMILREFPFNETVELVTLAGKTASTALTEQVPYAYRYNWPDTGSNSLADTLRLIEVADDQKVRHVYKGIHFRWIGDYIYTNQNDAKMRVIVDDPVDANGDMYSNPLVKRAIASKLAVMLALPITGDPKIFQTTLGAYDAAVRDAMANNGNRGNTVVSPPDSEYQTARLGG